MLAPLLGALLLLAPPAEADYDDRAATADAKTVLRARGTDYLDARARLEAHPEAATKALLATLEQPLGPAEKQRVLSILSGFHRSELVPIFASLLRKALLAGDGMEPWRNLLLEQKSAAADALMDLAGDRELSTGERSVLLDDLVTVIGREKLASLAAMLGRGDRELRNQLRRSLTRRGRHDLEDGEVLRAALDETITNGDPAQQAAALRVRAELSAPDDAQFESRLVRVAGDETTSFIVRVAAIRALREHGGTARDEALATLARHHLAVARRSAQASEILGWLALRSLAPGQARSIADELDLVRADAPRLAAVGYEVGSLGGDWLEASRSHPWPQVRVAALGRVAAPCERDRIKSLAKTAGPVSRGGEEHPRVARAAIVAIGRCADPTAIEALAKLMVEDGIPYEQRAEAARQLVERGGSAGADLVARTLAATGVPVLAERLAGALARASEPSDLVRQALCITIRDVPNAAATARRSIDGLFPNQRCESD